MITTADICRSKGFTLLEVLVALAIIAIALTSLLYVNNNVLQNYNYLKNRTFSHWVAMNIAAEYRLRKTVQTGFESGKSEMGGARWHWEANTMTTPDPLVLKSRITVKLEGEDFDISELVTYHSVSLPEIKAEHDASTP